MNTILILNSGGYDSTVLMHLYKLLGYDIFSLTVDYGQPKVELGYARKTCDTLGIREDHRAEIKVDMHWAIKNALYSGVSAGHVGYVPMRNAIFLSYALSICETLDISSIAMGLLGCGDFADNSPDFADDFNLIAGRIGVNIQTPLGNLEKVGVYKLGNALGINVNDTWSCNTPVSPEDSGPLLRCGLCNSCTSIKEAIRNDILKPKKPLKFHY